MSEVEYKITPKDPVAKAGKITFNVKNAGSMVHAFAIQTPSGVEQTSDLSPGSSATLTVVISKAGSYTFYCPIPGHRALGMVGTLKVGSAAGSGSGGASAGSSTSTTSTSPSGGSSY